MLLHIRELLGADDLARARSLLAGTDWIDGRASAGEQAARVKHNQQLAADAPASGALREIVVRALERHPAFLSAALPRKVFPPMFNRYGAEAGHAYGDHVDGAVRHAPAGPVRTDISCTLFLADPSEYDGGELVVRHAFGEERVRLPAGDLLLYPGTSVHRVEPVTRGTRLASFFWVQSLVRSDERRTLLHDMDGHLMHLRATAGETDPGVIGLTGTYHNLLRLWADT